tara:strand:+ start:1654 stop:2541 length:888 start_codon:yes stop_codon:yes gene_type:complete
MFKNKFVSLSELIKEYCLNEIQNKNTKRWLDQKLRSIKSAQDFFISFALINKKIPRDHLQLSLAQIKTVHLTHAEFNIENWTLDQLCRLSLLMYYPLLTVQNITKLISVADNLEQITIFKSIPYLKNADQYAHIVVNGLRTNIVDVFDAIALKNSYPAKHFSQDQWNQMVLKAIFMERPIYHIKDIDERKNEKLAHILFNYALERWAASRRVTPELWRMIRGYLTEAQFFEMKKQMVEPIKSHQKAMLKLIQESNLNVAQQWLNMQSIQLENISWDQIGSDFLNKNQVLKNLSKT